eukprot:gene32822-39682_t
MPNQSYLSVNLGKGSVELAHELWSVRASEVANASQNANVAQYFITSAEGAERLRPKAVFVGDSVSLSRIAPEQLDIWDEVESNVPWQGNVDRIPRTSLAPSSLHYSPPLYAVLPAHDTVQLGSGEDGNELSAATLRVLAERSCDGIRRHAEASDSVGGLEVLADCCQERDVQLLLRLLEEVSADFGDTSVCLFALGGVRGLARLYADGLDLATLTLPLKPLPAATAVPALGVALSLHALLENGRASLGAGWMRSLNRAGGGRGGGAFPLAFLDAFVPPLLVPTHYSVSPISPLGDFLDESFRREVWSAPSSPFCVPLSPLSLSSASNDDEEGEEGGRYGPRPALYSSVLCPLLLPSGSQPAVSWFSAAGGGWSWDLVCEASDSRSACDSSSGSTSGSTRGLRRRGGWTGGVGEYAPLQDLQAVIASAYCGPPLARHVAQLQRMHRRGNCGHYEDRDGDMDGEEFAERLAHLRDVYSPQGNV